MGTTGLQHKKLGSRLTTAAAAPAGPPRRARRGRSAPARALRETRWV
jgi:hypothetical protein